MACLGEWDCRQLSCHRLSWIRRLVIISSYQLIFGIGGFCDDDAVAALLFASVHGTVGHGDDLIGGARLSRLCNSESGGNGKGPVLIVMKNPVAQLIQCPFDAGFGAVDIGLRKDDGEFLTAVSAECVAGADRILKDLGDGHKYLIADLMAVVVVDLLEPIDIAETERHGLAVPA